MIARPDPIFAGTAVARLSRIMVGQNTFVSAVLLIRSHGLTTQLISEKLGLEPTASRWSVVSLSEEHVEHKDEAHLFIVDVRRQFLRRLPTDLPRTMELVLKELLAKLEPVGHRLDQIREDASIRLICTLGYSGQPEWVTLSEDLLRRIVSLKIPLTFCAAPLER